MSTEVENTIQVDSIEEAIEAVKNGEVIIVVDDLNRENEGDFICAAETVTPEIINFMATHGRGLICAPIIEARCEELGLELMVGKNTALHETPFTVSVDLLSRNTSTGISASDRSLTIQALIDPATKPEQLGRPGHIFPLRARQGGVLRRTGHTEAAIDFARLAGFQPAGVLVEIMNEDGTMARLPDLRKVADRFNLKLVTIEDLIEYRLAKESLIERAIEMNMPTPYGDFDLVAFRQLNTKEIHIALKKGVFKPDEEVLTRVHTASIVEDVFKGFSQSSNKLDKSMSLVAKEGKGIIVYMNQDISGESLLKKIRIYQNEGKVEVKMDKRDFGIGAQILRNLGVHKLKLITNNKSKRVGLIGYGIEIVDCIALDE